MRGWLAIGVIVVMAARASTAAATPGAIVIPPGEIDLGAGTPLGDAHVGPATELRIGVHWASLYWKPTPLDIGIGYVGSFRDVATDYAARATDATDNRLSLHGLYFNAAYAIETHPHWRTWLGARVEGMTGRLGGQSYNVIGGAVRLAAELCSIGVGGTSDSRTLAVFAGTFALGVYVEGTTRTLPTELGAVGVGAGVTMRVPLIAAIGG